VATIACAAKLASRSSHRLILGVADPRSMQGGRLPTSYHPSHWLFDRHCFEADFRETGHFCTVHGSLQVQHVHVQRRQTMEKFMHERNLELYRLQLSRTTNEDIRRQLSRLITEEKRQHLPRAGRTAPNFSFSRRDGSGGAAAPRMWSNTHLTLIPAGSPCAAGRPKALPKVNYALRDGHCN